MSRSRVSRRARLTARLLGCVLAWQPASGTSSPFADGPLLEGAERQARLAGGESRSWTVRLAAGQYLRVAVEQRGVDVVVRLATGGRTLAEVDSPNGRRGREPLSWISETGGEHEIAVAAAGQAPPGEFVLRVEALRAASPADRLRTQAEAQTAEAARQFFARTAASLRAALSTAQAALSSWRGLGAREGEARALHLMGLVHKQLGEPRRALENFRESLAIHGASGDLLEEADDLNQIGLVHWSLSEEAPALDHFQRALSVYQELADTDGEAQALNNLALVHRSAGRLQPALEYSQEALALEEAVGHPDEAIARNNVGSLQHLLGDPDEALRQFERALPLLRARGDRAAEADTINNLGNVHMSLGSLENALRLYQEGLDVSGKAGYRRGEAASLNNLGLAHLRLGAFRQALTYLERSRELTTSLGDRRQQAVVLTHLGRAHLLMGERSPAASRLAEADALWEALGDKWGRAYNLLDRADALSPEDAEGALALSEQSLARSRAAGDAAGEAAALDRIGEAQRRLGDTQAAGDSFASALRLREASGDRFRSWLTRFRLARVEAESGRLDVAQAHLDAALDAVEALRGATLRPDLRTSFLASSRQAHDLALEVRLERHVQRPQDGHDAAALELSERFRARTLLDVLAEQQAEVRQDLSPALADRLRSLQRRINALANQGLEPPAQRRPGAAERARALDALLQERRELDAHIRAQSPRYAALIQPRTLSVPEIQRELDGGTVVLEYALGPRRSVLWAVSADRLHTFLLPPRAAIEEAVRRTASHLSSPSPRPGEQTAARALSRMLLGPAAGLLGSRRLAIVADGALQSLAFAALPDPRAPATPLLAAHEVVSLPSASVLGTLRRDLGRPRPERLVAVFADPVFDAGDPRVRPAPTPLNRPDAPAARSAATGLPRFFRLPGTRSEALAILTLARGRGSVAALDFDATRARAVRRDLAAYRFVHFATHSSLDPQRPELSGIVLSLVDAEGAPLDGLLRLHEIVDLELGAELVILSACDTALGADLRGEGLAGLARGFMHAGVPRVVGSLWKVPDAATAETMQRLYRGIFDGGLAPAGALRRAQLAVRAQPRWRRPYHWAGFVLQGDWR